MTPCIGLNRIQQSIARVRNLAYGAVEGLLIGFRGLVVAADLPHKLQGGGRSVFTRGVLVGLSQNFDTSAHRSQLRIFANLVLCLLLGVAANNTAAITNEVGYIVAMYPSKDTPGLGGYFNVTIDGRKVAKLRYPTYYRMPVPPGAYTITMDAPSAMPILCNVIAGETCYVRARHIGKDNRREAALLSPEEAYRELRNTFPLDNEYIYIREWKKGITSQEPRAR